MKKHKLGAVKLFFLFATLGAFPFLYPAMQFQHQSMPMTYDRAFEVRLNNKQVSMPINSLIIPESLEHKLAPSKALAPIDPALGSEVQPDSIE